LNEYILDQYFEFCFNLSDPSSGVASDADATPTYRVYEENNDTAVASGNCALRDDANTTGFYYARAQITTAAGYENGKIYNVRVAATVSTISAAAVVGTFKVVSSGTGAGAITWEYTLTDSVSALPIADADVWVTTDLAGTNVVASGRTDQSGSVTFYLDAGTVYVWSQKSGYNFSNPDTETVS